MSVLRRHMRKPPLYTYTHGTLSAGREVYCLHGGVSLRDGKLVLCPEVRGVPISEFFLFKGDSNRGAPHVRISVVVRFSECPLKEVRLYNDFMTVFKENFLPFGLLTNNTRFYLSKFALSTIIII